MEAKRKLRRESLVWTVLGAAVFLVSLGHESTELLGARNLENLLSAGLNAFGGYTFIRSRASN